MDYYHNPKDAPIKTLRDYEREREERRGRAIRAAETRKRNKAQAANPQKEEE
jgi:hypothetical protein